MAIATMSLIVQTAAMMGVTAVDKMLILSIAQSVNANSRWHVQLDIIAHWWEMVIAMMNSTIQTASMMAWTAVDLMSTLTSVLSALASVSIVLQGVQEQKLILWTACVASILNSGSNSYAWGGRKERKFVPD